MQKNQKDPMTGYLEKVRTDGRTDGRTNERTDERGSIYRTNLQSRWVQKDTTNNLFPKEFDEVLRSDKGKRTNLLAQFKPETPKEKKKPTSLLHSASHVSLSLPGKVQRLGAREQTCHEDDDDAGR